MSWERRLRKEFSNLTTNLPGGIVSVQLVGDNLREWDIDFIGAPETLYANEKFRLKFKFSSNYPFDSPEVIFDVANVPTHPHVYSNGHICVSVLADDWSPALSVESVCMSIISMLSSAKEKKSPQGDRLYVNTCSGNPKKTRWHFHDDDI